MNDKSILKSILKLAWPTVLEQAMQSAVQYVDYAMVGAVGTAALAAVGLTSTVTWLVNGPLWAFGTGFLACVARAMGAGETDKARRTAGQAVLVSVALGALLTLIIEAVNPFIPGLMGAEADIRPTARAYFGIVCAPLTLRALLIILGGVMRGAGDTKTPMLVNIALNLTNIALNFLLIYPTREVLGVRVWGAGMGVVGAAWATAASYALGGILMLVMLVRHKAISPPRGAYRLDRELLKPCLKITLPAVMQRMITFSGQVTFASMVNSLGTIATAAHSAALTAESAFYIPGYGMQAAAASLEGNACGAGDKPRMRRLSRALTAIILIVMTVTGALLFILAKPLMGVFSDDPKVISLGTTVLKMVAISEPVYGLAIILEGIFHGVGDTLHPFIYESVSMWGVRILGTFITVKLLGCGLVAAWACMIAHNVALAVFMTVHYRRGSWNPLGK